MTCHTYGMHGQTESMCCNVRAAAQVLAAGGVLRLAPVQSCSKDGAIWVQNVCHRLGIPCTQTEPVNL